MNRWLVGTIVAVLTIFAMIVASLYLNNSYSKFKGEKEQIKLRKKSDTNKTLKLQTTILEVKRAVIDYNSTVATEVDDYISSQNIKKQDINNSKKIFIDSTCKVKKIKKPIKKKIFHDNIARLAIIMDDIGSLVQVDNLKQVPYPITPSIFPRTNKHPKTPSFTKEFDHYMVHMPMEAYNFSKPEDDTLEVVDTLEKIDKKISSMHKDFPNALAINNHTGSKFTSDFQAMDRLFCVLDKYDIKFIDSKTAPHTLGDKMAKLHNEVVLQRDVFLDNKPDVDYILSQIKKAVDVAKRKGVAIAICHPRVETFEALKEAEYLYDDIKLVYIDELY